MDQAKNVSQTAAFARRVACRTLTVVGGMAAGTAIAWCLAAAAASASTSADVPAEPVEHQVRTAVTEVQDFAAPVTGPVKTAVGTVAQNVQDPPPPPEHPLRDLGEKVKHVAENVRADAENGLGQRPGCAECLGGDTHHEYPADGLGRSDLPAAPALAPVAGAAGAAAPGGDRALDLDRDLDAIAHRTARDRASAGGMSRRGSPAPAQPLPGLPGVPAPFPFTPGGVPTTGGHGCADNSAGSHLFAALPWQDTTFVLMRGGIAAACDAATSGRPGTQPGVAPD